MFNVYQLLQELRELDMRTSPAVELLEYYSQLSMVSLFFKDADEKIKDKNSILEQCSVFMQKILSELNKREQEHQILVEIALEDEDFYYEYLSRLPFNNLTEFYEEVKRLAEKDPEKEELINIIGDVLSERFLGSGGLAN